MVLMLMKMMMMMMINNAHSVNGFTHNPIAPLNIHTYQHTILYGLFVLEKVQRHLWLLWLCRAEAICSTCCCHNQFHFPYPIDVLQSFNTVLHWLPKQWLWVVAASWARSYAASMISKRQPHIGLNWEKRRYRMFVYNDGSEKMIARTWCKIRHLM